MSKNNSSSFWYYYDKACAKASLNPKWEILNLRRLYAIDQAAVNKEFEELITYSLDEQYYLIMSAMFDMLIDKSVD